MRHHLLVVVLIGLSSLGYADTKKTDSTSSPSGGNQLSGLSYEKGDWPSLLTIPSQKHTVVLCFQLKRLPTNAVQPAVLEPSNSLSGVTCSQISDRHPLVSGDMLVIAIATNDNDTATLQLLNINVTSQAGTSMNAAPVRPTLSTTSGAGGAAAPAQHVYFLSWPWRLMGDTIPTVTISAVDTAAGQAGSAAPWKASTSYKKGDTVTANGHVYTASNAGTSGVSPPAFPTSSGATVGDNGVTWQESGTPDSTPPGGLDNLLSLTLPQVHQLYYYNVATGIAGSSVHSPTFSRIQQTPAPGSPSGSPAIYFTETDNGANLVAPMLMFSAYLFRPIDAESKWRQEDLIPALGFGFSLTSPSTSFYAGGSSEIRRNVQLVYGANIAKVNELVPNQYIPPTSSTAPVTRQRLTAKPFIGLTLNVDFIKGLFGGGSSSSSSSSK